MKEKINNQKIKNGQKIRLDEISTISSGVVINRLTSSDSSNSPNFSNKSTNSNNSNNYNKRNKKNKRKKYYHITQKSVSDNKIDSEKFKLIFTDKKINKKYLAEYKDIIIKLAPPYSAAVIDFKRDDVIVPSNFAIIKIHGNFISVFLAYILNGSSVREQLKNLVEGTTLKVIKISHLKDLKVTKRDTTEQIEFSKLFYLMDIRNDLIMKKTELEEKLKDNILSKL